VRLTICPQLLEHAGVPATSMRSRNQLWCCKADIFRVETFSVIVNQLQTALRGRIDAYTKVRKVFKVVTEFNI